MRNIVDTSVAKIWNGTNKLNENNNGGVAVWSLPPQAHNAYNPILFKCTKYLHEVSPFTSPHKQKPNYLSIDNVAVQLVFQRPTTSFLYVEVTTNVGKITAAITRGSKTWGLKSQCASITSIDGIGLSSALVSPDAVEDEENIYLRPGQGFQNDKYICKDAENIVYRNDDISTCSLTFGFSNGDRRTLSADTFAGKAIFNAKTLVTSYFASELSEFGNKNLIVEPALFVYYTVSGVGNIMPFLAINAVAQIGRTSDRTKDAERVLSMFASRKLYEGYPTDYSVLTIGATQHTAHGDTLPMTISRLLVGDAQELTLKSEAGISVDDTNLERITLAPKMDIRIERPCTPPQPFYVRWINELGGLDYWMFGGSHKRTVSLKEITVFNPSVRESGVATGNIEAYGADTGQTVTVGATGLTRSEYYALSKIPFSPLIEFYDIEAKKWLRLIPQKVDNSTISQVELLSIELSFILPDIYTQY